MQTDMSHQGLQMMRFINGFGVKEEKSKRYLEQKKLNAG